MLMEISWNSTRAKSCICSGITPHNTNRPMLTLRDSFAEKDPGSQWTTWWLGDSRCPCSKEIWPCSGLLRVKPEREWSFASLWHLMDYTWMKYCTQFWVHLDKDAGVLEEQTHQDWNPCTQGGWAQDTQGKARKSGFGFKRDVKDFVAACNCVIREFTEGRHGLFSEAHDNRMRGNRQVGRCKIPIADKRLFLNHEHQLAWEIQRGRHWRYSRFSQSSPRLISLIEEATLVYTANLQTYNTFI